MAGTARRRIPGVVIAVLGALLLPLLAAPTQASASSERWIIDTDMGIDDWAAILLMASKPDSQIRAITTTGNGLATCAAGERNAPRILRLAADREPVGCSNNYPMDGTNTYPKQWRDETDSLLDIPVPKAKKQEPRSATGLMKKTLRNSSGKVSILSLGPMSNIAEVLEESPSLEKKIRRIVAMGGAVDVPGNIRVPEFTENSSNTVAEWNMFIDPLAAKIVFDSRVPLEIVPLDATNKVPLTPSFTARFKAKATGADGRFAAQVFDKVGRSNDAGEYFHWDPLAAAIADDPKICERREKRRLTVISEVAGPSTKPGFPARNWFGDQRNELVEATAGGLTAAGSRRQVTTCMRANVARFEQHMIDAYAKPNR
jgi:inosine-uridine nucleoside N-ribohydrolase